jgi:hypothetical protein
MKTEYLERYMVDDTPEENIDEKYAEGDRRWDRRWDKVCRRANKPSKIVCSFKKSFGPACNMNADMLYCHITNKQGG